MREAGVMLIIKDGLILGVSRRYDRNKFGLPGGKVEPGETPKEAAIRETFEETGYKVQNCVQIYKRVEPPDRPGGEPFFAYAFYATEWSGKPATSEEGALEWITKKDLISNKGAFPDYNRDTLKSFQEHFSNIYIKEE